MSHELSGSSFGSDQTLVFEFGSGSALSRQSEVPDPEMNFIWMGVFLLSGALDQSGSICWCEKKRETHGANE